MRRHVLCADGARGDAPGHLQAGRQGIDLLFELGHALSVFFWRRRVGCVTTQGRPALVQRRQGVSGGAAGSISQRTLRLRQASQARDFLGSVKVASGGPEGRPEGGPERGPGTGPERGPEAETTGAETSTRRPSSSPLPSEEGDGCRELPDEGDE